MQPSPQNHLRQRLRNAFHSVVLISAMLLLLGFTADLVLGPGGWWLGIATVGSILIGMRISPLLVMYLYRARPLPDYAAPDIHQVITLLCQRAGLSHCPQLYYIPSSLPTAFTSGHRNQAVIAVSDGMLRQLNLRELAAVLAHEMSHIRHHDTWVMSLADGVSRITALICTVGFLLILAAAPFLLLSGEGLPWLGLLMLVFIPHVTTLLQLGLSRTREFDADLGAVELTHDPIALISALEKLEGPGDSWFTRILMPQGRDPHPSLLRSHPRLEERIQRLEELVVPEGAPFHEDRYVTPHHIVRVSRPPRRHWSGIWY